MSSGIRFVTGAAAGSLGSDLLTDDHSGRVCAIGSE